MKRRVTQHLFWVFTVCKCIRTHIGACTIDRVKAHLLSISLSRLVWNKRNKVFDKFYRNM